MKDTLQELRDRIDEIDKRLFELLQERLTVVGKVGHFKKSSSASHQYIIRAGREALKVKKAYHTAKEAGFDHKISMAFAALWRELISLSINFEEEAKIACSRNSIQTLWMLREYFGPYSDIATTINDAESIADLKNKKANIAAFDIEPKPSTQPWWLDISANPELAVFANLPLFPINNSFPKPTSELTLLVSNVTPEPSGDDKFIYVITKAIPADEKDTFKIISEYKNNYLVISDEFYNNYRSKLNARYLGCFAVIDFK